MRAGSCNSRRTISATSRWPLAVEATRLWAADGIVANAVNPGGIATGLQRNFTPEQKASLDAAEAAGVLTYKTVEQGAATSIVTPSPPSSLTPEVTALDPAAAQRLWTLSTHLLRV